MIEFESMGSSGDGMTDRLAEIQQAIDSFQMDTARGLLREELAENPGADAYYLASRAAITHGQRVEFLEKTLELDPTHPMAREELADIRRVKSGPAQVPTPSPAPESVPPRVKLASFGKRWLAILIDGTLVALPTVLLMNISGAFLALNTAMLSADDAVIAEAFSQFQNDFIVMNLLVSAAYNLFFMTRFNGQTPGKMMLGLRAVKKNGARFRLADALLRNVIGYTLSGMFLLGYLWALFDRESQTWHDKLAGTVVIDERAQKMI